MSIVKMYDEEFVIDHKTSRGYDKVLKKIEPLISDWASKVYFGDMPYEDKKQEIFLIAIQGIRNYDETKGVKLSSFLHTHIKNKIISKIKSTNKKSNNASFYVVENKGYVGEIPLSYLSEEGEAIEFLKDTSSLSHISDENIMIREIEENLGIIEADIARLLQNGHTIKSISEETGLDTWKVTSIIKKMRKSKLMINYAKNY